MSDTASLKTNSSLILLEDGYKKFIYLRGQNRRGNATYRGRHVSEQSIPHDPCGCDAERRQLLDPQSSFSK